MVCRGVEQLVVAHRASHVVVNLGRKIFSLDIFPILLASLPFGGLARCFGSTVGLLHCLLNRLASWCSCLDVVCGRHWSWILWDWCCALLCKCWLVG